MHIIWLPMIDYILLYICKHASDSICTCIGSLGNTTPNTRIFCHLSQGAKVAQPRSWLLAFFSWQFAEVNAPLLHMTFYFGLPKAE
jgi:hypothetical protein